MKKKNLILKYSGMLFFVIGIILTIRMYTENAWPTYLFFIMCIIGLIQIITAFTIKQIKITWQIFWSVFPIILIWFIFS